MGGPRSVVLLVVLVAVQQVVQTFTQTPPKVDERKNARTRSQGFPPVIQRGKGQQANRDWHFKAPAVANNQGKPTEGQYWAWRARSGRGPLRNRPRPPPGNMLPPLPYAQRILQPPRDDRFRPPAWEPRNQLQPKGNKNQPPQKKQTPLKPRNNQGPSKPRKSNNPPQPPNNQKPFPPRSTDPGPNTKMQQKKRPKGRKRNRNSRKGNRPRKGRRRRPGQKRQSSRSPSTGGLNKQAASRTPPFQSTNRISPSQQRSDPNTFPQTAPKVTQRSTPNKSVKPFSPDWKTPWKSKNMQTPRKQRLFQSASEVLIPKQTDLNNLLQQIPTFGLGGKTKPINSVPIKVLPAKVDKPSLIKDDPFFPRENKPKTPKKQRLVTLPSSDKSSPAEPIKHPPVLRRRVFKPKSNAPLSKQVARDQPSQASKPVLTKPIKHPPVLRSRISNAKSNAQLPKPVGKFPIPKQGDLNKLARQFPTAALTDIPVPIRSPTNNNPQAKDKTGIIAGPKTRKSHRARKQRLLQSNKKLIPNQVDLNNLLKQFQTFPLRSSQDPLGSTLINSLPVKDDKPSTKKDDPSFPKLEKKLPARKERISQPNSNSKTSTRVVSKQVSTFSLARKQGLVQSTPKKNRDGQVREHLARSDKRRKPAYPKSQARPAAGTNPFLQSVRNTLSKTPIAPRQSPTVRALRLRSRQRTKKSKQAKKSQRQGHQRQKQPGKRRQSARKSTSQNPFSPYKPFALLRGKQNQNWLTLKKTFERQTGKTSPSSDISTLTKQIKHPPVLRRRLFNPKSKVPLPEQVVLDRPKQASKPVLTKPIKHPPVLRRRISNPKSKAPLPLPGKVVLDQPTQASKSVLTKPIKHPAVLRKRISNRKSNAPLPKQVVLDQPKQASKPVLTKPIKHPVVLRKRISNPKSKVPRPEQVVLDQPAQASNSVLTKPIKHPAVLRSRLFKPKSKVPLPEQVVLDQPAPASNSVLTKPIKHPAVLRRRLYNPKSNNPLPEQVGQASKPAKRTSIGSNREVQAQGQQSATRRQRLQQVGNEVPSLTEPGQSPLPHVSADSPRTKQEPSGSTANRRVSGRRRKPSTKTRKPSFARTPKKPAPKRVRQEGVFQPTKSTPNRQRVNRYQSKQVSTSLHQGHVQPRRKELNSGLARNNKPSSRRQKQQASVSRTTDLSSGIQGHPIPPAFPIPSPATETFAWTGAGGIVDSIHSPMDYNQYIPSGTLDRTSGQGLVQTGYDPMLGAVMVNHLFGKGGMMGSAEIEPLEQESFMEPEFNSILDQE